MADVQEDELRRRFQYLPIGMPQRMPGVPEGMCINERMRQLYEEERRNQYARYVARAKASAAGMPGLHIITDGAPGGKGMPGGKGKPGGKGMGKTRL